MSSADGRFPTMQRFTCPCFCGSKYDRIFLHSIAIVLPSFIPVSQLTAWTLNNLQTKHYGQRANWLPTSRAFGALLIPLKRSNFRNYSFRSENGKRCQKVLNLRNNSTNHCNWYALQPQIFMQTPTHLPFSPVAWLGIPSTHSSHQPS